VPLYADYHDGQSSRVRAVELSVAGDELLVRGDGVERRVPFRAVEVAEKLGSAPRRLGLPDGAFCEVRDHRRLETLLAQTSHREGIVDLLQRHLPFVCLALVATGLVLFGAYRWGLPWAAGIGAQYVPPQVGRALTSHTLKMLDSHLLQPSSLGAERQQALDREFRRLLTPEGRAPDSPLLFRSAPALGPNAFTLPDGSIVLLDELVRLLDNDRQIVAVLAHELGHARHRHAMRMLLQSSAVAAFWAYYVGDISSLLATAPTVVVQAHYSQELEQEADDYAAATLLASHASPLLLVEALQKLQATLPHPSGGGYLSTHPATGERMQRLQKQAATQAAT